MADSPIASAYVQIRPDLSAFRDELRSGLASETDGLTGTVRINADTADADTKLKATGAQVDDLGKKNVSPTVTVNDDTAKAKLLELQARIDELQTKTALIRTDVDDSGARQKLTAIAGALDTIGNETIRPKIDPGRLEELNQDLDDLDVKLERVGSDMDTLGSKSDTTSKKLGASGGTSLLGAAVALSPALAEIGVVGAGALAGVAVAAVSAGAGLGAFALAAGPALTYAKTQASGLLSTWQNTQAAFTQPVISEAIGLIPGALTLLDPLVATTSQALLGLEGNIEGSLGSPALKQFSSYIAGEGGAALTSFGKLAEGAGTLFAGFAEGMAPEIERLDADFVRWGADLSKWGADAKNGGLTSFVDYLQTNGPKLASTLESVGSALVTIGKDSAPLGSIELALIGDVAKLFDGLSNLNPALVEWGVGLAGVAYSANKLLGPVGGLTSLPTIISKVGQAASGGGVGLLGMASAASPLTGELLTLGLAVPGLDIGLAALAGNLILAGYHAGTTADGFAKLSTSWGQNFVNSIPAGTDALRAVNSELGTLQGQFGTLQNAEKAYGEVNDQYGFNGWTKSIGALSSYGGAVGKLANDMLAQGVPAATSLSNATAPMQGQYDNLNQKIGALQHLLPGLTAAQNAQRAATEAANTAMGVGAGYTGNYATEYGVLSTKLQAANAQLTNAETLLNTLLGKDLSAAQATTSFYSAVDSLTSSLKTNGTSMDNSTAKGNANQQAFEGVGAAITTVITTMEKQGSTSDAISTKVQSLTSYIVSQATKYGLTTAQVEAYLTQLGLTPAQVKTDIVLSGVAAASASLQSIVKQIDGIPKNTTVSVTLAESLFTAAAGGASGVSGTNSTSRLSNNAVGGQINRTGRGFRASSAAIVGEDGSGFDEYVIPTNPAHRSNAMALTGGLLKDLGVMATGGVLANQPTVTDNLNINLGVTGGIGSIAGWVGAQESTLVSTAQRQMEAAAASAGAASPVGGNAGAVQALAMSMAAARGWTGPLWNDLNAVEMDEAGWNLAAANPTSDARGIAQFINGWSQYYTYGGNPNTASGQVTAFLNYVQERYGNPAAALAHENAYHWYDTGGILQPGLTLAANGTGQPETVLTADTASDMVQAAQLLTGQDAALTSSLLQTSAAAGTGTAGTAGLANAVSALDTSAASASTTVTQLSTTLTALSATSPPFLYSGDNGTVNTVGGVGAATATTTTTAPDNATILSGVATAIQNLLGHNNGNGLSQTGLPNAFYQALQPALSLTGVGNLSSELFQTGSGALSLNGADAGGQAQLSGAMQAALAEIEAELGQLPKAHVAPTDVVGLTNTAATPTISPTYNINVVGGTTAAETAAAIQQALDAHTADLIASLP